jgi:flagellar basal-body rod protein FlgF
VSRGADGLFRSNDGQPLEADATTRLASGVLEGSNVDLAGSMVNMIELSRNFDLQIKALHASEDNASASAKLLQSS